MLKVLLGPFMRKFRETEQVYVDTKRMMDGATEALRMLVVIAETSAKLPDEVELDLSKPLMELLEVSHANMKHADRWLKKRRRFYTFLVKNGVAC